MIKRLLFLCTAACLPGLLLAATFSRDVTVPFGSVKVVACSPASEPGVISSLEHRFYHSASGGEFGSVGIVPSAGPLHVTEGTFREDPGTFRVRTDDPVSEIQIASTSRGAVHRYAFFDGSGTPSGEGKILLDLTGGMDYPGEGILWSEIRVEDERTVTGCVINKGDRETGHTFFAIRFSRPVRTYYAPARPDIPANYPLMRGTGLAVVFVFDLVKGDRQYVDDGVLEIQIAFSSVDASGALNNMKAEHDGKSFETLLWEAGQQWQQEMAVVTIDDPRGNALLEKRRDLFYRALYQAMLQPAVLHDIDGRFRGNDNSIHTSFHHVNYASFHPSEAAGYSLMTFIKPERSRQFVASLLAYYDKSALSLLPGGNNQLHSVSLLSDAHVKGILPASLTPRLLDAVKHAVSGPYRPEVLQLREAGFIPAATLDLSIGLTLDLSYENWCLIRMAGSAGDFDTVNGIRPFVTSYQWLLDPRTGYARQRNRDLSWFDGPDSLARRDELLYVPHNMADVVERTGGRRAFEKRLDSTGRFNELPYLYLWTGSVWKGQQLIKEMMDTYEESNEAPSWFVFSAMGLYPLCPGTDQYVLGAPYFKKMTIQLENGKLLTIEAPRLTDGNRYVKEVRWNGKVLDTAFITSEQLMQGGVLEFSMTSNPVRGRTFRNEKLPYSYLKK